MSPGESSPVCSDQDTGERIRCSYSPVRGTTRNGTTFHSEDVALHSVLYQHFLCEYISLVVFYFHSKLFHFLLFKRDWNWNSVITPKSTIYLLKLNQHFEIQGGRLIWFPPYMVWLVCYMQGYDSSIIIFKNGHNPGSEHHFLMKLSGYVHYA